MKDQEMLAGSGEIAEDSGTLGLTVYGNVGADMQTVLSYTDTGQVQSSLAWLTGGFTGTEDPQGPEPAGIEIAQLWDDNDISQVPFALAWVTGDFTGTGNAQILQPWMTVLS
jgi:hypothetical protein